MSTVTAIEPVWGAATPLGPRRPLPERADVVIVGGGITGVSLLEVMRARGVDAVLVERDHVGAGASGRNAGFLLAGVSENYAHAVRALGRHVARQVWAFTLRNHELVVEHAGPSTGYRRLGSMTVAVASDEAESLEEAATLLAEDGLPGALTTERPFPGALAVLHNPVDGEIDPLRLVRAIADPNAERIIEGRRAVAVEDGQNTATVHLDAGSINAGMVVLATNAWTAQLAPRVHIRAVRAQMLATSATAPRLPCPVYAEWGHRYWRQRADGRVLVGGFRNRATDEEVGYDLLPTTAIQAHLERQLVELGVDAPVTHRWAGTMGFSPDGLPLVGRVPGARHVAVCAGFTGHGMGFAVHSATVLGAHLLDSAPIPGWLDARRLSTA